MFIKLRFSTAVNAYQLLKIIDWCINNRPATGSNLATQLTTAGYTLSANIDQANTQIWNSGTGITALTSKTVSKFTKIAATSYTYQWYVEQEAYDNPTTKHVTGITETAATTAAGDGGIYRNYWSTTGSMVAGITSEPISASSYGTATLGGSGTLSGAQAGGAPGAGTVFSQGIVGSNIQGVVLYVTDNCLIFSIISNTISNLNLFHGGTNATNVGAHRGLFLSSQYTRTDPWNTASSLIPPWVFSGQDTNNGNLFMSANSKFTTIQNTGFTLNACAGHLMFDRVIDNAPTTTLSTQPYVQAAIASVGVGHARFDETLALTVESSTASVTSSTTPSQGVGLSNVAGSRFIAADLKSQAYALLPLCWASRFYNVQGGSLTDRAGIWWYNGDYFPGDTLVYNGKTYVLFNGALDQSARIALAVPRE